MEEIQKKKDCQSDWDSYSNDLLSLVKDWAENMADIAYREGYLEGYRKGLGDSRLNRNPPPPGEIFMSFSVDGLKLPTYVKNALLRSGHTNLRDIVSMKEKDIRMMPKLGPKGIRLVAQLLRSIGFEHTDWEICADQFPNSHPADDPL